MSKCFKGPALYDHVCKAQSCKPNSKTNPACVSNKKYCAGSRGSCSYGRWGTNFQFASHRKMQKLIRSDMFQDQSRSEGMHKSVFYLHFHFHFWVPYIFHYSLTFLSHPNCFNFLCGAANFGGSNIDPTTWEDKKCKGKNLCQENL
ncbi:hypothetical protein P8452_03995 [Trifolium repens]|nr:hypothetical protein P8452_03995 [Trifolium repens]